MFKTYYLYMLALLLSFSFGQPHLYSVDFYVSKNLVRKRTTATTVCQIKDAWLVEL